MADGKCMPEEEGEPPHKCTDVSHFGGEIETDHKYESGQNLSSFAPELGFMVSALNTIVKDAACIKKGCERNDSHKVSDNNKKTSECNNWNKKKL